MHWWNEFPDPAKPEIWAYAPRLTFSAGETVDLHVNASRARFNVVVTLEAVARHCIFDGVFDTGRWSETGETCYADGCDWPVLASFRIPDDAPAGAYRIKLALEDNAPVHHLLVFVRSEPLERKDRILLVAATNTYAAYNNWGGASHYGGMGHDRLGPSHRLNARRPWARGIVWLPEGAPRIPDFTPTHESGVRYPHVDWAKSNGVYRYYAASGWAHFERHFVVWAEANGFAVDVVCQSELHEHPQCLNGYKVVACVGHDEYWTWEMRDAIDSFVDAGGNVVRLAGNFMWQTRLNTDNGEQTTYKYSAREHDPVYRSAHPARTTTSWEAREVSRPGALTFGVNATRGMYAGFGGLAARGARGFTVYRPDHWMFEGTWLGYGDLIGNEARCFGYEVDGLDYVIEGGLPRPSGLDPAPDGLEIVALGVSTSVERGAPGDALGIGDEDGEFIARLYTELYGPKKGGAAIRGCGAIVAFERGKGSVVTVGSCEWVAGLLRRDADVEQITRNMFRHAIDRI